MFKKSAIRFVFSIFVALSVLLAGCTPAAAPTQEPAAPAAPTQAAAVQPTEAPAAAAAEEEPIKIGAMWPLTGPSARDGEIAKKTFELAEDVINNIWDIDAPYAKTQGIQSMGGRKIKVIFVDHQSSPEIGISEAQRLITEEKVVAILGAYNSSVAKPVSEVCERLGTPFIDVDSVSPVLPNRGLTWYFQIVPDAEAAGEDMIDVMDYLDQNFGADTKSFKHGLIYENTDFGQDSAAANKRQLEERGYNVVTLIHYSQETTDLSGEVLELKNKGVDVVWQGGYTADSILFVKTMKELNYNPKLILAQTGGATNPDFVANVGKDGDYWITPDYFSLDAMEKKPLIKVVNDIYREKYGEDLASGSVMAWEGLHVVVDALERAGTTDKEKLREALRATDIPEDTILTLWKGIKFDERGYNSLSAMILNQLQDKRFRLIIPRELSPVEFIYPMPAWNER